MPEWTHTGYAQQIVFGAGAVRRLPELLKTIGIRRALLVTTEGRHGSEEGSQVVRAIGSNLASTFSGVESHVPTPAVHRAVLQARTDAVAGIASFGGGR